jgi:predicted nucleic acid-binding protein
MILQVAPKMNRWVALAILILAAALEAGCTVLYSEDMQDGQKIDSLTIRNPFLKPALAVASSSIRRR